MRGRPRRFPRHSCFLGAALAVSAIAFAEQPTNAPTAKKPNAIVQEVEGLLSDASTPTNFPDARTYIYRELKPEPLRLFVVTPEGWRANGHRPALVYFFGGTWTRGNSDKSIGWARMAAKWGMVGIAPDYRTADRFGTTPVEATADARAAVRWVEDHATDLGIDTNRIVVALHDKLVATSNTCKFITFPDGGHGIPIGWKDRSRDMIKKFLEEQRILPVANK